MKALTNSGRVDGVVIDSRQQPQLIYIHSAICPSSARARQVVLGLEEKLDIPIYNVTVQDDRPTTAYIEQVTDVQHESPQLIMLWQGKAVADWDHAGITEDGVFEAVMQLPAS